MTTDVEVARWRLRSHHLVDPGLAGAGDVVRSLLAVQAENPGQSAWAVACRTATPEAADLAALLDSGRLLRTHVLRPTWHYVSAEDLVWLLELTGPRVRRTTEQQLRTVHGIDERLAARLSELVLEALAGRHLTRSEVAQVLEEAGHPLTGQALMILLAELELQGRVVSGPLVDGRHSYAPLADRVVSPRRRDREEALAELALRYFTGHGPATEADLSYWATLTLTDVRAGLAAVAGQLESFEHDGRRFWHAPGERAPTDPQRPAAHLLQVLDETYRGYQDSRWVLDAAGAVPRERESAIGMVLLDGQLVAAMKRSVTARTVDFEVRPYASWSSGSLAEVEAAAARYGSFLGREPVVRLR